MRSADMPLKRAVSAVSYQELLNIRSLASASLNRKPSRTQRLASLHCKSKTRSKNWGNTLESLQAKALLKKREQLRKKQEKLSILDAEDRERHERTRREAVSRARIVAFENSDEVKSMMSGMLLSDVLHERKNQAKVLADRAAAERRREKRFVDVINANMEVFDKLEALKIEKKKKMCKTIESIQLQQLKEFKNKKLLQEKANIIEGEEIKRRAQLQHAASIEKARQKSEQIRENKLKLAEENRQLEAARVRERERIAKEEEKIAEYARVKDLQQEIRKQGEGKRYQLKLDARQKIIDAQVAALAQIKSEEDSRVTKYQAEAELQAENKERRQRDVMAEQKRMIDECRQIQLNELKQRRHDERREATLLRKQWSEDKIRCDNQQNKERAKARQSAVELSKFHFKQIAEKREAQFKERNEQREWVRASIAKHKQHCFSLRDYANNFVEEYKAEGRDVKPVYVALRRTQIF